MKTWQSILFGTFLGLAAAAVIMLVIAPPRGDPIILTPPPTPDMYRVYVTGAVNSPGVVALPRDSRITDAIAHSGGFSTDADLQSLNLAARINDGDRIYVSSRSEVATKNAIASTTAADPKTKGAALTPTPSYPININTATSQELEALPNIGSVKAEQIVTYRQQHGPFLEIDDIQNVPGIGPTIFEKISTFITISN
jgi:competence protein ComEA